MEKDIIIYCNNLYDGFDYKNYYTDIYNAVKEVLTLEDENLNKEVSISFVDNDHIRKINNEFRGIDQATDVLSFPMDFKFADQIGGDILGDIIISIDKVNEQSIEYKHSFKRELIYLIVHSMLHLLSYDHILEEDRIIMRNKEKEIMGKLDILR